MSRKRSALFVALAGAALVAVHAAGIARVPGEKVDSGLGSLPHYSQWKADGRLAHLVVASVPGEKVDNGLGSLPHYSQWKDHPELYVLVAPTRTATR